MLSRGKRVGKQSAHKLLSCLGLDFRELEMVDVDNLLNPPYGEEKGSEFSWRPSGLVTRIEHGEESRIINSGLEKGEDRMDWLITFDV